MIPPNGCTIRHNRDDDFGLWPAGDGKSEFRDYFSVHEGPDSNLCVFKVFLWVNSEGVFVYHALSKRYGDAWLQEFFLTWAVERIARGLHEGEFVNGQDKNRDRRRGERARTAPFFPGDLAHLTRGLEIFWQLAQSRIFFWPCKFHVR